MNMRELRQKTKEELIEMLRARRMRAEEVRFMLYQKKIKNVKELREVKKDIARILTLLAEKNESCNT